MLTTLAISNYRSLRDLVIPLEQLNVVTGPNGSGKSNLYRALGRLIARASARSQVVVVTHASVLIKALEKRPECHSIRLKKEFGETKVSGKKETGSRWNWPSR